MKAKILTVILAIVVGVVFGQDCVTPYNPYEENSKGEVILTSCQSCQLISSKVVDLPIEFREIMDKDELKELFRTGSTNVSFSKNEFNFLYPLITERNVFYENGNFRFGEENNAWIRIICTQIWTGIGIFIVFWFCVIFSSFLEQEDKDAILGILIVYVFISFIAGMNFFDYVNAINIIVLIFCIIGLYTGYVEEKKVLTTVSGGADSW